MGLQDLTFLVFKYGQISEILKTIIFVNKIEDAIKLKKYLYLRFSNCVYNKNQASVVIRSFTSNLDINIKTKIIEDLKYVNTQICICMQCVSMGINILDIIRIV